jgi:hypothetical protein
MSLLELLLALSGGLLLVGVMLQAVLAEARGNQQLGERLRQRAMAGRALALISADGARASRLTIGGTGGSSPACGLAGRQVLLHLEPGAGAGKPITYTLGQPPSAIWRGAVLMRCGPAFGLDGEPSAGASLNRVVLDGLQVAGTRAERISGAVVRVSLQGQSRVQGVLADRS